MIWLSAILVFGTLALVVGNVVSDTPDTALGAGWIVEGPVPWRVFALLWGGIALGAASFLRGRRWWKAAVVLLEIVPVAFVSWYVLAADKIPLVPLEVAVGDPFPAYALADQDGTLHDVAALEPRKPTLYIFYRGHW